MTTAPLVDVDKTTLSQFREEKRPTPRMITLSAAFLLALLVATALTPHVRDLALRYGWVDANTSTRKIHQRPIPRLGGVAIVLGFFAPLLGLLFVDSNVGTAFLGHRSMVVGLFVGGAAVAAIGLVDDFRGLRARHKLIGQVAVAVGLYLLGFRIEGVANPFGEPLRLGLLSLPLTVLWIVGITNALNLIDGLDGLAAGVALFSVITNFVLAVYGGDLVLSLLMAALGGALLGFLAFNFNPASIFMGDSGSMFLGFTLAAVSIKTSTKSGTAVAILVPVISLGLPIMDTLLAMVRRSLQGRPVFSADKEHIHHRLISRWVLTQREAVLVLYGLCCLFAAAALGLSFANGVQTALLLGVVLTVAVVLMRKLGYLRWKSSGALGAARKRNGELRTLVKGIQRKLRAVQSVDDIWEVLSSMHAELGTTCLQARLGLHEGGADARTYAAYGADGHGTSVRLTVPVQAHDGGFGALTAEWTDGRMEANRDEELALEIISDAVAAALGELARTSPRRKLVAVRD